jgi:hypothetical protein
MPMSSGAKSSNVIGGSPGVIAKGDPEEAERSMAPQFDEAIGMLIR